VGSLWTRDDSRSGSLPLRERIEAKRGKGEEVKRRMARSLYGLWGNGETGFRPKGKTSLGQVKISHKKSRNWDKKKSKGKIMGKQENSIKLRGHSFLQRRAAECCAYALFPFSDAKKMIDRSGGQDSEQGWFDVGVFVYAR